MKKVIFVLLSIFSILSFSDEYKIIADYNVKISKTEQENNSVEIEKVIKKEFSIGIMVSIVLALLNFIRLITFEKTNFVIAFVVSLTLVFTVIVSKLVGALLPLGAKIVKADPAVMATPLITTISDAVTLIIYFNFATMFLKL